MRESLTAGDAGTMRDAMALPGWRDPWPDPTLEDLAHGRRGRG